MHRLEHKVSSVQLWWCPGTARKHESPSSGWWHLACHVPGLGSSFLPDKGLSASGAGSIPLAPFPSHVSVLEVCLLFHSIMAGQFIRLPLRYRTSIGFPQTGLCGSSFKHASRQQISGTTLDKAYHVTGLYASSCHVTGLCRLLFSAEYSVSRRAPLLREVRGLLALSIHGVYCHSRLQVVAVMEGWVVWAVVVELVAQQGCSLRRGV